MQERPERKGNRDLDNAFCTGDLMESDLGSKVREAEADSKAGVRGSGHVGGECGMGSCPEERGGVEGEAGEVDRGQWQLNSSQRASNWRKESSGWRSM